MRYVIDHDYHLHTHLSLCSEDRLFNPLSMLEHAKREGLTRLVLTDHYWDENVPGAEKHGFYGPQNNAHIAQALPLPQTEDICFYFGCETEMDMHGNIGVARKTMEKFDFIVVPTTHLHMRGLTTREGYISIEERSRLWVERMDALLDQDLPFEKIGIAHPTCSLIADKANWEEHLQILDGISDEEYARVFAKVAEKGCGLEINGGDIFYEETENIERILRVYRIALAQGCKFYLGSDAHGSNELIPSPDVFNRIIDVLDLKESDKFHFPYGKRIMQELEEIVEKFAASDWESLSKPAKMWLKGCGNRNELAKAIQEADDKCGSCGCEWDKLYKRALELL